MDPQPETDAAGETEPDEELVIALKPGQLGALIAVVAIVILIWRAVRRPE